MWRGLVAHYRFDGPGERLLLTELCLTADRLAQVRGALAGAAPFWPSKRGGPRAHPALRVEGELSDRLARLARLLRLHLWSVEDHATDTDRV